jgi:hypothetical protein
VRIPRDSLTWDDLSTFLGPENTYMYCRLEHILESYYAVRRNAHGDEVSVYRRSARCVRLIKRPCYENMLNVQAWGQKLERGSRTLLFDLQPRLISSTADLMMCEYVSADQCT